MRAPGNKSAAARAKSTLQTSFLPKTSRLPQLPPAIPLTWHRNCCKKRKTSDFGRALPAERQGHAASICGDKAKGVIRMDISSINLNSILGTYGAKNTRLSGNLDEATKRLIEDKDADGNGTLSAAEIAISEEAFKLADTNDDGELDADELKKAIDAIGKELAAEHKKPGRHPILDLFRPGSEDGAETALNQIA